MHRWRSRPELWRRAPRKLLARQKTRVPRSRSEPSKRRGSDRWTQIWRADESNVASDRARDSLEADGMTRLMGRRSDWAKAQAGDRIRQRFELGGLRWCARDFRRRNRRLERGRPKVGGGRRFVSHFAVSVGLRDGGSHVLVRLVLQRDEPFVLTDPARAQRASAQ